MLRKHSRFWARALSLSLSKALVMLPIFKKLLKRKTRKTEKPIKEDSQFSPLELENTEFDYGHNIPIKRDTFVEDC